MQCVAHPGVYALAFNSWMDAHDEIGLPSSHHIRMATPAALRPAEADSNLFAFDGAVAFESDATSHKKKTIKKRDCTTVFGA